MVAYEYKTVKELREIAKKRGLSGYSYLNKKELIDVLRQPKSVEKPKSPKLERCIQKVKKQQLRSCMKSNYTSPGCYNPWAVCTSVLSKKNNNKTKNKSPTKKKVRFKTPS